jgi:hypothetical protein
LLLSDVDEFHSQFSSIRFIKSHKSHKSTIPSSLFRSQAGAAMVLLGASVFECAKESTNVDEHQAAGSGGGILMWLNSGNMWLFNIAMENHHF